MRILIGATALFALSLGISATAQTAPAAFPAGAGQQQTIAACKGCHDPSIISSKHYSAQKWGTVVDTMVDRGAKVSDADYDTVVAYLTTNFGTK